MFLASKNKDKITTAINDPLNGELVQQLRSYLDEDFLDEAVEYRKAQQSSNPSEEETEPSGAEEQSDTGSGESEIDRGSSRPSSAPSHSMTKDFDNLSDAGVPDETDPMVEETSEETETEEVEESKKVNKSSITPDLMSILNSSDKTRGVRRVNSSVDSELWIYYNDDVNLNNVMEPVISSVYTCCPNVQFSRLARTYNAVVFSV
jgi:hypothetical protein